MPEKAADRPRPASQETCPSRSSFGWSGCTGRNGAFPSRGDSAFGDLPDVQADFMLKPAANGPAVVACNTCRLSDEARENEDGQRGGALLVEALRRVQASDPAYTHVAVEEMPCLFACQSFCTVHLRCPGKVGYVMGKFTPDDDAARAILDYARAYADSDWGQVPYKQWPQGVKGHFLTRTPPEGYVVE